MNLIMGYNYFIKHTKEDGTYSFENLPPHLINATWEKVIQLVNDKNSMYAALEGLPNPHSGEPMGKTEASIVSVKIMNFDLELLR